MNKISSLNYDFDLFFDIGTILKIHVATAGGYVRDEIFKDESHNNFRSLLNSTENKLQFDYKLNPRLDEILSMKFDNKELNRDSFDRDAYINDFVGFAKKGLPSFDRTFLSDPFNNKYHLVAYPIFDEGFLEFSEKFLRYEDNFSRLSNPTSINNFINEVVSNHLYKPKRFHPFFRFLSF